MEDTGYAKVRVLQGLSDAIRRVQGELRDKPGHEHALALQRLQQQRAELLSTMRPYLVYDANSKA